MSDVLELYARALHEFGRRVHAVPSDRWGAPSPNPGWDVRALVTHVVEEQLWAPPLLAGARIGDIGQGFPGAAVRADPVRAWEAAAAGARAAFTVDGALGWVVGLSYGERPAEDYCREMTMDLAVHAWDLARGAGLDDRLDPALVQDLHDRYVRSAESLSGSGLFAPVVPVGDSADLQVRTLALFGRDARTTS